MLRFLTLMVLVASVGSANAADTLTILHLNDSHSNLTPAQRRTVNLKGAMGGIAKAATFIGMTKATAPNVLTLHAGDYSIGDLFYQKYFGVAELRLLGAIGIDAMALGNHEFDLTPAVLTGALSEAFSQGQLFPVLSANLVMEDSSLLALKQIVTQHTVMTIGGAKVGIFGMLTPETNLLSQPSPAFVDTNIVQIATEQVELLRAQGCSVVIMLSHLGSAVDRLVSQYVSGIDLIVGGHDHTQISADPGSTETPIVQTDGFYHSIGMVQLEIVNGSVRLLSSVIVPLDESVPEDQDVADVVTGLVADIEGTSNFPFYTQQIAVATDDFDELAENLTNTGPHSTSVGNLVCDVYRAWGNTDIGVQPGGSTAQPLYKGPIVSADVFRTVGYGFNENNGLGFRMATFSVLGAELVAGLEFGVSSLTTDEYLVQVGGMSYAYNPMNDPGSRIVQVIIGDSPLEPTRRYTVTTNEFVLMFFGAIGITPQDVVVDTSLTEYMLLADQISTMQTITPNNHARVTATPSSSVQVEPNPWIHYFSSCTENGAVVVTMPHIDNRDIETVLYSANLQQIPCQVHVDQMNDGTMVTVSTHALLSGTYLVRITAGEHVHLGRILVVN